MTSQSASTARVLDAASAAGVTLEVRTFPDGVRTAADAARAVGCDVAAIVKSLVFEVDGEPVVALVPGDRRLDAAALALAAGGASASRADLETVRRATGFSAGGVPPFGHVSPLRVFADEQLRRHDPLWTAAGTPTTVCAVNLGDLDRLARPVWSPLSQ